MIAMTGSEGFLGWHTRAAARESNTRVDRIAVGAGFDLAAAAAALDAADEFIHIAGVNRAPGDEVREGNLLFAAQAAQALAAANTPPSRVVYANSTQSLTGSEYGEAKLEAAAILRSAAERAGAEFVDVVLPNLFGEHGRPFYNSVTATFAHVVAEGGVPEVDGDRLLTLVHAQDAADALLGVGDLSAAEHRLTVTELRDILVEYGRLYRNGEIPDIAQRFQLNLFNTYRSYTFPAAARIGLVRHADARGSFFEVTRTHGGTGQSSFSTSEPNVTRGEHYHRRKIERFTVLMGSARIALRRLFGDEVIEFHADGDNPVAIDMPTMWVHNITNIGEGVLYLALWTNDIFDPDVPDTIPEAVR